MRDENKLESLEKLPPSRVVFAIENSDNSQMLTLSSATMEKSYYEKFMRLYGEDETSIGSKPSIANKLRWKKMNNKHRHFFWLKIAESTDNLDDNGNPQMRGNKRDTKIDRINGLTVKLDFENIYSIIYWLKSYSAEYDNRRRLNPIPPTSLMGLKIVTKGVNISYLTIAEYAHKDKNNNPTYAIDFFIQQSENNNANNNASNNASNKQQLHYRIYPIQYFYQQQNQQYIATHIVSYPLKFLISEFENAYKLTVDDENTLIMQDKLDDSLSTLSYRFKKDDETLNGNASGYNYQQPQSNSNTQPQAKPQNQSYQQPSNNGSVNQQSVNTPASYQQPWQKPQGQPNNGNVNVNPKIQNNVQQPQQPVNPPFNNFDAAVIENNPSNESFFEFEENQGVVV